MRRFVEIANLFLLLLICIITDVLNAQGVMMGYGNPQMGSGMMNPGNPQMRPGMMNPGNPQMGSGMMNPGNPQMRPGMMNPGNPQMGSGMMNPGNSQMGSGMMNPGNSQMRPGMMNPGNPQMRPGMMNPGNPQMRSGMMNPGNPQMVPGIMNPENTNSIPDVKEIPEISRQVVSQVRPNQVPVPAEEMHEAGKHTLENDAIEENPVATKLDSESLRPLIHVPLQQDDSKLHAAENILDIDNKPTYDLTDKAGDNPTHLIHVPLQLDNSKLQNAVNLLDTEHTSLHRPSNNTIESTDNIKETDEQPEVLQSKQSMGQTETSSPSGNTVIVNIHKHNETEVLDDGEVPDSDAVVINVDVPEIEDGISNITPDPDFPLKTVWDENYTTYEEKDEVVEEDELDDDDYDDDDEEEEDDFDDEEDKEDDDFDDEEEDDDDEEEEEDDFDEEEEDDAVGVDDEDDEEDDEEIVAGTNIVGEDEIWDILESSEDASVDNKPSDDYDYNYDVPWTKSDAEYDNNQHKIDVEDKPEQEKRPAGRPGYMQHILGDSRFGFDKYRYGGKQPVVNEGVIELHRVQPSQPDTASMMMFYSWILFFTFAVLTLFVAYRNRTRISSCKSSHGLSVSAQKLDEDEKKNLMTYQFV